MVKMGILVPWQMQENGHKRFLLPPQRSLGYSSLRLPDSSISSNVPQAPDIYLRFTSTDQLFETDGDGIMPASLFHALVSQSHFTSGWPWEGTVHSDFARFAPEAISPFTISLRMTEEAVRISIQLPDEAEGDVSILKDHLPAVLRSLVGAAKTILEEHYPNLAYQLSVFCGHVANKKNRIGKSHNGSMKK